MDSKLDFDIMFSSSRARVYLLWAALTGVGFTATHFYQKPSINILWFIISIIGLGYMYKVMPLGVSQMKNIYKSWLVPIIIGLAISVLLVRTDVAPQAVGYLGSIWLVVMAAGYLYNGLSDVRGFWYYIASGVNVVAAAAIYLITDLQIAQYLIAAIVSVWSMLMLWAFYSEV